MHDSELVLRHDYFVMNMPKDMCLLPLIFS